MWFVFLASYLLAITTVRAQQCARITEYHDCVNKHALAVSECNNLVTTVPDANYWRCICTRHTSSLQCYSYCPDDPQLDQQRRAQEETVFSTCQYVKTLPFDKDADDRFKLDDMNDKDTTKDVVKDVKDVKDVVKNATAKTGTNGKYTEKNVPEERNGSPVHASLEADSSALNDISVSIPIVLIMLVHLVIMA